MIFVISFVGLTALDEGMLANFLDPFGFFRELRDIDCWR